MISAHRIPWTMTGERGPYRSNARNMILWHMTDEIYGSGSAGVSDIRPEDYGLREFPPYFRHNSVTGVVRSFEGSRLVRGGIVTDGDGREHSILNRDNVKKAMDSFVEKGILVRRGNNVRNIKLYFPNETPEGFTAYVDHVSSSMELGGGPRVLREDLSIEGQTAAAMKRMTGAPDVFDGSYRDGDVLLNTRYCRMMMDRSLILRRLRSCFRRASMVLTGGGAEYSVSFPLVGRYLRVHEDRAPFDSMAADCRLLAERVSELTDTEVVLDLMGRDRSAAGDRSFGRACRGARDRVLSYIDAMAAALESESGTLGRISEGVPEGFDPLFWFAEDPDGSRRMEAYGSRPVLDPEDEDAIRRGMRVYRIPAGGGAPAEVDAEAEGTAAALADAVIREYPSALDDLVVLPTLCLVQMSPSAMIRFANGSSRWGRGLGGCIELDPGAADRLNRDLFADAVADLLAGRHRRNVGWSTQYEGFGEYTTDDGARVPALLTFRLGCSRHLSFAGGGFVPPFLDARLDLPTGIGSVGNGLRVVNVGDGRYSEHLLRCVTDVGFGSCLDLSCPCDIRGAMQRMMRYRAVTGEMPEVFRPHGSV